MPAIAEMIDRTDAPHAVKQALAQVAAAALGAAVGGTAGLASAVNVEANNRQLHPTEKDWIKSNAGRYATQKGISAMQAQQELTAQADRQVQSGSPGTWDQSASEFLSQAKGMLAAEGNSGPGYMFYATPEQKANPNMYAYSPVYGLQGSENWPFNQNIVSNADRSQAIRQLAGAGTIASPVASIMLLGVPIVSSIGGTAIYATIGGTTAGGLDAAGQYAQSGQIRPIQSLFAGSAGAIAAPIGAATGFMNNVLLGGTGGVLNTAFNNAYYGEKNSLLYAGALGSFAGAGGYLVGSAVTQGTIPFTRPIVYPNFNPKIPILFQGIANPFPGFVGATAGSIASGGASFVPGKVTSK